MKHVKLRILQSFDFGLKQNNNIRFIMLLQHYNDENKNPSSNWKYKINYIVVKYLHLGKKKKFVSLINCTLNDEEIKKKKKEFKIFF